MDGAEGRNGKRLDSDKFEKKECSGYKKLKKNNLKYIDDASEYFCGKNKTKIDHISQGQEKCCTHFSVCCLTPTFPKIQFENVKLEAR